MKYELAPSMLSCDFGAAGEQLKLMDKLGAGYVHLDMMDGAFVPSISFGMPVIKSWRKYTDRFFDVHMMVSEPIRYISVVKDCGADLITVHAEACSDLEQTICEIHKLGIKAGVSVNPATPLSALDPVLDQVDMILIMGVNPGFGGQKYIPGTTEKIQKLRQLLNEKGLSTDIEVDGGVTLDNIREILDAGANIIVAGSAVFKGNMSDNIPSFLNIFEEYQKSKKYE